MPPAASSPGCAQDRAVWSLYVLHSSVPPAYQPVCMATLAVSNETAIPFLVGVYRRTVWFGRFLRQPSTLQTHGASSKIAYACCMVFKPMRSMVIRLLLLM